MTTTTQAHYDAHLGPVYPWMAGDFEALCRRSAALFDRLGIFPDATAKLAVDLGAGHGAQSLPLAERGFDVVAVDFCDALLDELRRNAGDLPIRPVHGDLLDVERHATAPAGAVVCMGDTLPHLESLGDVERLVHAVGRVLAPAGRFVATFRDYVSAERSGVDRFIPVKADDERILTCVLEYAPQHVTVNDLLHVKRDGRWCQQVSSYRKLRLDPEWLARACAEAGLDVVERSADAGLVTFVAARR